MDDQILIGGLMVIAWSDAMHRRIPNQMLLVLLVLRVCLLMARSTEWKTSAAGFLIGGIVMLLAYLLSPKSLGAGDVKLMAIVGSYVGIEEFFSVLFISCFSAAIYSQLPGLKKEIKRKAQIPFAPFVLIGVMESVLC